MRKLATALALVAMTAGSLLATEGASFAAARHHGKRPVIQKVVSRKKARRTKSHKRVSEKVRRHRKNAKTPQDPGMGQFPSDFLPSMNS